MMQYPTVIIYTHVIDGIHPNIPVMKTIFNMNVTRLISTIELMDRICICEQTFNFKLKYESILLYI